MDDLKDLYQEVILDHNRNPRNFRELEGCTRKADGYNPLCGDRLTLFLHVDGDVITDATFKGTGCAISKASASLLTETVKGKTVAQAEALFRRFQKMVTSPPDSAEDFSSWRASASSPCASSAPAWRGTRCARPWTRTRKPRP